MVLLINQAFILIGSLDPRGNVCNQRCLSVFLSVFCLFSVCNANISEETIIARAAKFGMFILHIKSANSFGGILKYVFVLEISNFGENRRNLNNSTAKNNPL